MMFFRPRKSRTLAEEVRAMRLDLQLLTQGIITMTKELDDLKTAVAAANLEMDKEAAIIAGFKTALDAARNSADPSADLSALSASLGEHPMARGLYEGWLAGEVVAWAV